jgi:hypothetical protein
MNTSTLEVAGTPGFWSWVFIHPFLSFAAFCFLVLAVFGTIESIGVALARRGEGK